MFFAHFYFFPFAVCTSPKVITISRCSFNLFIVCLTLHHATIIVLSDKVMMTDSSRSPSSSCAFNAFDIWYFSHNSPGFFNNRKEILDWKIHCMDTFMSPRSGSYFISRPAIVNDCSCFVSNEMRVVRRAFSVEGLKLFFLPLEGRESESWRKGSRSPPLPYLFTRILRSQPRPNISVSIFPASFPFFG